MDNDDRTIGRILSRREALRQLGALTLVPLVLPGAGAGAAAAPSVAPDLALQGMSCVVRPTQTVGPYFVDTLLDRSDVRTDPVTRETRPGAPLDLTFNVTRIVNGTCTPFDGAVVDIWQCDVEGVYSDVRDPSFDTRGQRWLRGFQRTDAAGRARFTTVYPGWYRGRTVHIHFKIRTGLDANAGEFVSQLYFDDGYTDAVFGEAPYAGRPARTTRNTSDGIFRRGGSQLLLDVTRTASGHAASFNIGVMI